jgi:ABC-type lipoprotein export system ATPase subunit
MIQELLPQYQDKLDAPTALMSGGEKKRIAIARYKSTNADLLYEYKSTNSDAPTALMSGGEKKRIAIARYKSTNTDLLYEYKST